MEHLRSWQHQLPRFFNQIVPHTVKPSYTWVMRYRPGASLERHTDRPQCRWNLSFCVDGEPDLGREGAWPLHLVVDGRAHAVRLGIGDAVLYSGTDTPHWRDELSGERAVSMCFFHYVSTNFDGPLG